MMQGPGNGVSSNEEDFPSKDKMFPHEFMFLIENAQDRQ